jgi:hypothetical protein
VTQQDPQHQLHEHLQPEEIDRILDGEAEYGVPPDAAAESCPECQAMLEEARQLFRVLESLPRHAPTMNFADSVMAEVTVLEPWHVALQYTVRRFVPRSRPARVAALALACGTAGVLSVGLIWLVTQTDVLVFVTAVAGNRIRDLLMNAAGEAVVTLFGPQAATLLTQSGTAGLAVIIVGFMGATAGALASLRVLAGVASRRRN